ncbi:hypothetical protein [Parvibaculum sp.]|uniref:hypothetical protein n=1 Tax=Parvibaculum sp. TaxID=2024848 RepID=UPI000C6380F2|nr:hypothetical protein [Parvibaculum sp.]MAM94870.1 hypothetical protein [Parvibaculum sp.]HCX67000.1 hypothetical protein [Rhodobiaceae bacterium]
MRSYETPALAVLIAGVAAAGITMLAVQVLAPKLYGEEGGWILDALLERFPAAKKLLSRKS